LIFSRGTLRSRRKHKCKLIIRLPGRERNRNPEVKKDRGIRPFPPGTGRSARRFGRYSGVGKTGVGKTGVGKTDTGKTDIGKSNAIK
jgi:hypothetical protein